MEPQSVHSSDFDALLDLESQFYASGFNSGLPHGELHGLFEGRELGRDKSWELWEEIGYYQGVAQLWKAILKREGKESSRQVLLRALRLRGARARLGPDPSLAQFAGLCSRSTRFSP